jgi:hypothetical protein
MGKANGGFQKRVPNFKQNTRKEETSLNSNKKKQQSYYSVYTLGNFNNATPRDIFTETNSRTAQYNSLRII